uniref:Uncharacterized protein n=1 Tax=Anguilla anguilla TaxID=7936 RepID=A0A0E9PTA0_ANGAN
MGFDHVDRCTVDCLLFI